MSPGYSRKTLPSKKKGLIFGPQSKPLREPNLAPSLNPSGNQIGRDVSPVEATAPRNIAADVAESVAALKLSGGEGI